MLSNYVFRFAVLELQKLIQSRWDIYHRSIRDVKLALLHCGEGEMFQAQMHSQYLFALSYRPFGTGGFAEDKRRILEVMLGREDPESFALWDEWWETIRDDLKMPQTASASEVWRVLPSLACFSNKGTMPKLGRWFSWNQSYHENVASWNILKMVLQYHFSFTGGGDGLDPDVAQAKRELDRLARMDHPDEDEHVTYRKQFSLLKEKLGGGLKLAWHLMSWRLLQLVHIIAATTAPIWKWYSDSVKGLKNVQDNICHQAWLAQNWQRSVHLQELAGVPTAQCDEVVQLLTRREFAGITDTPEKVFELSARLLEKRAWSLSRSAAPPDCYSELLGNDPVLAQARVSSLVKHKQIMFLYFHFESLYRYDDF